MTGKTAELEKRKPLQTRAVATYEKLLASTGHLLSDLGIDNISTNRIVDHAGLTPPAFYRYFRDKYHVLETLGERLMEVQNTIIAERTAGLEPQEHFRIPADILEDLLVDTVEATKDFPGGPWLTRALRAVPNLQKVRLKSHQAVAGYLVEIAMEIEPDRDRDAAYREARLAIELGYAAVEMCLEEDDLDVRAVMRETAKAIAALSD